MAKPWTDPLTDQVVGGRPITATELKRLRGEDLEDWEEVVLLVAGMRREGTIRSEKPAIVIVPTGYDLTVWPDIGVEILRDRHCPDDQIQVMGAEDFARHNTATLKALYGGCESSDGPYWAGQVRCSICLHGWVVVCPVDAADQRLPDSFECPRCGNMSGEPVEEEEDE
jgi:hypothetical protein